MNGLTYLKGVATLALDPGRCNGCGVCATVCPQGVLSLEERRARIADLDACMECGACARNCERRALTVASGVGCASAFLNAALGRTGAPCCGPPDGGPEGDGTSGCCC